MKYVALILVPLAFPGRALAERPATEEQGHTHFYVSTEGNDN